VFSKSKFEDLEVQKYDVLVIGDVELFEDEKEVLRLHNKFSVMADLKPNGMNADQEASTTKHFL